MTTKKHTKRCLTSIYGDRLIIGPGQQTHFHKGRNLKVFIDGIGSVLDVGGTSYRVIVPGKIPGPEVDVHNLHRDGWVAVNNCISAYPKGQQQKLVDLATYYYWATGNPIVTDASDVESLLTRGE